MRLYYIWLVIAIASIAVDVLTTDFVFIGISFGGICATVTQMMGYSFKLQLTVFFTASLLFVIASYPYARRIMKKTMDKNQSFEKKLIGSEISIHRDIDINEEITVRLSGFQWIVKNGDKTKIKEGDPTVIAAIEGNKITIKHKEETK